MGPTTRNRCRAELTVFFVLGPHSQLGGPVATSYVIRSFSFNSSLHPFNPIVVNYTHHENRPQLHCNVHKKNCRSILWWFPFIPVRPSEFFNLTQCICPQTRTVCNNFIRSHLFICKFAICYLSTEHQSRNTKQNILL